MRDKKTEKSMSQGLAPASRAANATSTTCDMQGFDALTIAVLIGAVASGTHAIVVQESDNDSEYTAVAADDLVGTIAVPAANTAQFLGYKGTKRYVQVKIENSGVAVLAAVGFTKELGAQQG